MRSAQIVAGRRWVLVLEPGEELVGTVSAWAERIGVRAATVEFFGAFRSARLIAATEPVADPEPPLPQQVEVTYLEGVGSGSIGLADGGPSVHLHIAAGVKEQGGAAYAGHLLAAEVHYTVEVVVQEAVGPDFVLRPLPGFGINALHFS
ncbi:PPC domain-containing DNA-binding protein [Microbacterium sp. NPDC055683]